MHNSISHDAFSEPRDDEPQYSPFQERILAEIKGLRATLPDYPVVYYNRRWQELQCDTTISEHDRRWAIAHLQEWMQGAALGEAARFAVEMQSITF